MKKRILRPSILICLILAVCLILYFGLFYISRHGLQVSVYDLPSNIDEPIRIVQLTDLHNSEFGPGNQRLIDAVTQQNPDLIFLTGDLINDDDPNLSIAVNLIHELSQVAPVFASYGNHELAYEDTFSTDLSQQYQQAGATFLDRSWTEYTVGHTTLRIGGVYSYCLPPQYTSEDNEPQQQVCDYLTAFQDTQLPTVLLCHLPVSWLSSSLNSWDVDVVFAGHLHGGQVIIPGLGGLYAPDMGWFPGQLWGVYPSEDKEHTLILSRGLGSTEHVPRVNNIPEIVVVNLIPKN